MNILLYSGLLILLLSSLGYVLASKNNKENTSRLKKEQKAALKRKSSTYRMTGHALLAISLVLIAGFFFLNSANKYDFETLNQHAAIEVTSDKDYGGGHSEAPVKYEMAIPTSGKHNPHDLKFGHYDQKPPYEKLVHNLEHGDIIIYYHPDADPTTIERIKYLAHFKKEGAGILAMPNRDVTTATEVIATAWTHTMKLSTFDEAKLDTFIYEHINQGPEKIPASTRQGGGTM